MQAHATPLLPPIEEDTFLWEEDTPDVRQMPVRLKQAETYALRLCFDVGLQSAFALEDPNERFLKVFGHISLDEHPPMRPAGRQLGSAELSNYLYEVSVEDGNLGFEVNPPNVPALSRIVLVEGRPELVMAKVLLACERARQFQVQELPPLRLLEPAQAMAGNRFFRLTYNEARGLSHDVALLLAWMRLEDGADMLEIMSWPVEKGADPS